MDHIQKINSADDKERHFSKNLLLKSQIVNTMSLSKTIRVFERSLIKSEKLFTLISEV